MQEPKIGSRWRHKTRGGSYRVADHATLQLDGPDDMAPVVCYISEDGRMWVRRTAEFLDGRFEPIKDQ